MTRYFPLALCLLVFPASAEMYKWTDDKGNVHYSDQRPPSNAKKTETIKPPPTPAAAAPAPGADGAKPAAVPKPPAEQEMQFKKRRLEAAEAEVKAQKQVQAAEEKKRNCQRAKDQVTSFQRGGRLARPGGDGEQIYMEDKEIAQGLAEAKKVADSWCN